MRKDSILSWNTSFGSLPGVSTSPNNSPRVRCRLAAASSSVLAGNTICRHQYGDEQLKAQVEQTIRTSLCRFAGMPVRSRLYTSIAPLTLESEVWVHFNNITTLT